MVDALLDQVEQSKTIQDKDTSGVNVDWAQRMANPWNDKCEGHHNFNVYRGAK